MENSPTLKKKPTDSYDFDLGKRLTVSFFATVVCSIISIGIYILIILVFKSSAFFPILILCSIICFTSLLWNRVHRISVYLAQVIVCTLGLWLFIEAIGSQVYRVKTDLFEASSLGSFSISMDFLLEVPIILILTSGIALPCFQIFSNYLLSQTGFIPDNSRSLSNIYLKTRTSNQRKYYQDYIEYD